MNEDYTNRKGKYTEILIKKFGINNFKDKQLEIIDNIIYYKRDVCCILATGYGKSLCYQFPPIFLNKTAIIVSPLISLMNDQLAILNKLNIKACCYNSSILNKDRTRLEILSGYYQIIYITPELLIKSKNFFQQLHTCLGISLIGIDESHCIYEYGHDFRPSYRLLNCLKEWINESIDSNVENVPILALTGTATIQIQKDICNVLKLDNPLIIKSTFDRPNLEINVIHKNKSILYDLKKFLNINELTLIYCQTRADTEYISCLINKYIGIKAMIYHSGLDIKIRNNVYDEFIKENIKCIVATISFGMGINKTNIRKIIHYGVPKNLESYYQEIGRAGRDGLPSKCYILYNRHDILKNKFHVMKCQNINIKLTKLNEIKNIEKFILSNKCRRKILLEYFNESYLTKNNFCCDNCNGKTFNMYNLTKYGHKILQLINYLNKSNYNYGMSTYINIIRGSKSKKIPSFITNCKYYGFGQMMSIKFWNKFLYILISEDFIEEKLNHNMFGSTLYCTNKGIYTINSFSPIILELSNKDIQNYSFNTQIHLNNEYTNINSTITMHKNFNLEKEYINHCEHDLNLPIKKLNYNDKILYIMYQDRKFNINTISLLLNKTHDEIENNLIDLINKDVKLDLNNLNFNKKIYDSICDLLKKHKEIDIENYKKKTIILIRNLLKYYNVIAKDIHIKIAIAYYLNKNKNNINFITD